MVLSTVDAFRIRLGRVSEYVAFLSTFATDFPILSWACVFCMFIGIAGHALRDICVPFMFDISGRNGEPEESKL